VARGQKQSAPHYIEPLIVEYVQYRSRLGRKTHKGNESVLRRFAKEWDNETRNEAPTRLINNLTVEWVEDYFLEMYGEREPVTKRAYQSQIKQFIVWMGRYGVSKDAGDFNPGFTAGKSLRPKVWLSAEQMREVWDTEEEVYWSTLFMFLALTCCRINEAQAARWGDIVGEQWNPQRSKTKDLNSFLRLSPRLRDQLNRYQMWCRAETGRQIEVDDYIFPAVHNTVRGKVIKITDPKMMRGDLAHRKIKSMIVRCFPQYENEVGIGCHTLRRSGAQALLEALAKAKIDHALFLVSKILGHDKTSTTESYLNIDTFKMAANVALETVDLFDDQEAEVVPLRLVRES
jgi:integrase